MRRWAYWIGLSALFTACSPAPIESDSRARSEPAERSAASSQEPYFAIQAKDHEAYPEAGIRGLFRMVNGCALLDDALLIFPHGTVLQPTTAGLSAILFGGSADRELRPGITVLGGGGHFPLDQFTATEAGWPLQAPVPERCRRLTGSAVVVGPDAQILPPSRQAERLYAAVHRDFVGPGLLAPVGGVLRVENQCLLLDDKLVVLPAGSSVEFNKNGSLEVRIASDRYLESVLARPGDRISGGGGSVMAEDERLPAMPLPLVEPIPERCRPTRRRGLLLNRGATVARGVTDAYSDPGAAGTFAVPPPAPPRPVSDPADCPPGSNLASGMCRNGQGRAVRPKQP